MLVTMEEYQNMKAFLQKGYMPNWSEDIFVITKVKNTFPWTYVISNLNVEEIVWKFYKKRIAKKKKKSKRI